ncbi:MAG: polysaccharide deacetylase family protein [Bryobacteraceae bacterium]|nr:polysaccharide deacetylase family protein [Bryobacteraceae bacterium]
MVIAIAAVALFVTVMSHTAPAPFVFDAFAGKLSVWRAPAADGRRVAYLTFDDGPNPTATPAMLDLLRVKNVRATFFLIEEHITPETAPIVRRMFDEGHTVGQHSRNRWLMMRTPGALERALAVSAARIEQLAGRRPCAVFRPHGGWRSVSMLRGVKRAGYKLVGWSWMSWDWYWFKKRTGENVSRQIIRHASPGQIIVIHDGHHENPRADRRYAIEAARLVIEGLRAKGYDFATFCESGSSATD